MRLVIHAVALVSLRAGFPSCTAARAHFEALPGRREFRGGPESERDLLFNLCAYGLRLETPQANDWPLFLTKNHASGSLKSLVCASLVVREVVLPDEANCEISVRLGRALLNDFYAKLKPPIIANRRIKATAIVAEEAVQPLRQVAAELPQAGRHLHG